MSNFRKIELKVQNHLSHHPKLYALIVGIGIVMFWRGVWHSIDSIHTNIYLLSSDSSIKIPFISWWDGPFSFIIGAMILSATGAFTSSFIGNELILSGLRGEKRLSERTDAELKDEVMAISDIKEELIIISSKLAILEKQVDTNHKKL